MSQEEKIEIMKILSRFEGFLFGAKIDDEFINSQLEIAMNILNIDVSHSDQPENNPTWHKK